MIAAGIAVISLAAVAAVLLARLSPLSKPWVVRALSRYYGTQVTLATFHVTLYPHIVASGEGLVLQNKTEPGGEPLASVRRFSMQATWIGLLRHPRRINHVRLEGLTINVPPGHSVGGQTAQAARHRHELPPIYLSDIEADGTVLTTLSGDPNKPPRVFAISKLRLRSVGVGKAMSFEGTLTNPKPIGEIQTKGNFGPWDPDEPSRTPVKGEYEFRNADLSTIRGIAGILSSEGKFQGVLDRIEVDGTTDTPEFSLGVGNHSESLRTTFHAIVDGITGQTLLQPVRAMLNNSLIIADGAVIRTAGVKGTTVQLNVTADHADLGDLLHLAVKSSQAPMSGAIDLKTTLEVVPGPEEIEQRLRLHGGFTIATARFTDPGVEDKITHLSQRGEGQHGTTDTQDVPSNFDGRFDLSGGLMSFSKLTFQVPGASVDLQGTYGLQNEELNFVGTLNMKATLSQMTTGIKSSLLKIIDPLFKGKNAGTVVPIKISGNRSHPEFSVRYHDLLKRFGL